MEEDADVSNDLYTCKHSTKADAITVTFHNSSLFRRVKNVLSSSYSFQLNKNENGIESFIFENNTKTVVTLYNNNTTLFIQGKGCRLWKENILDEIMENESLNIAADEIDPSTTPNPSPSTSPVQRPSNSPLNVLNRLVNQMRSPSKRTPLKTKNQPVKSNSKSRNSTSSHKLSSSVSVPVCDHSVNDGSQMEIECCATNSLQQTPVVNMDETKVKQVVQNELSLKEMEKSVNLLRTKLNEQSEKTNKLEKELSRVKDCLKTQNEKNNALTTEINHLKKELSTCTAKCLVLEEDKSNMKKKH